jgi:hypothetical protein
MPRLGAEQLPTLAGALLRLRGMTLTAVFEGTGIRTANLSAWLKGKPQVISAARVASLMYHLGLQGGQLRTDVVHAWADYGEWTHLRTVFRLLNDGTAPRCLFLDENTGMSQTCFLRWGKAWVRLSTTQSATEKDNLAILVKPDQVLVLPLALEGIPINDIHETRSALLTLTEQVGQEIPSGELAQGFMQGLIETGDLAFVRSGVHQLGWTLLEESLRKVMRAGMSPAELAVRIDRLLP